MLKAIKFICLSIVCVCVMVGALIFGFKNQIISVFAPANMDQALIPDAASQFYDAKGNVIYTTLSVERRLPVTIDKISKNTQNAFIAIEDNRFYEHSGIDLRGTARAVVSTLSGREVQGGSTITQQLAKNAFTNQERTIARKIKEAFLALAIESKYTKKEILCMYLNQIYFGQGAYGIEAASKYYFGVNTQNLSLAQAAALAAIPKSPNYFNPFSKNVKDSAARKNLVLDQMAKYNFITQAQANAAKKADLKLAKYHEKEKASMTSYFYDMVTQEVIEHVGADSLYKDGLKVYTTIDMDMQAAAERAVSNNLPKAYQVAVAAVEPKTGAIKAMVGGRGTDKYNRAYLAARQPGSSFKPFVYVTAMQNGFTPASVIEDKKEDFGGGWIPLNSDKAEHGKVSVRTALVKSMNIPTVKIARSVGVDKIIANAEAMGITTLVNSGSKNDVNLAMSLGGLTKGVNPLEMAAAYAVFANNGTYVKPYAISKIVNREGKVLYEHKTVKRQAVGAKEAYLVTNMLEDVLTRGTAAVTNIGRPAAGKTGTTDNFVDAWFVGFTPDLSTAVWVGDDNSVSHGRMYGSDAPLNIWDSFMRNALRSTPAHGFVNPGVSVPAEPAITQDKAGKPLLDKNGKPILGPDGKPLIAPTKESDNKITDKKKSLKDKIKEAAGKATKKPVVSNQPVKQ